MNRKERRAKKASNASPKTADDIPMGRPTATQSKGKTLLELAAERQAKLSPGRPFDASVKPENIVQVKIGEDGRIISEPHLAGGKSADDIDNEDAVVVDMPFMDSLLLAVSLSAIHFTLSFLTMHQYAQEIRYYPLIFESVIVAFPTLLVLIHFLHGHLSPISPSKLSDTFKGYLAVLRSVLYVVTANIAGCYLVKLTNEAGYYAVIKNAPGIGTLWVFAVLELGLAGALSGVIGPGLYAWWYGYGLW